MMIKRKWHELRAERYLVVGPVMVTTRRRHERDVRNALDLGRDYGRMEVGASPVPPKPAPHLRAV